jgi:hypothetical protein
MRSATALILKERRNSVMAIAVVYRPPSITAEQYNLSWSGGDGPPLPAPPGLLFHAGVGEGDAFFTVTVWETREAYEAFAPRFKDAMSEKGLDFGTPNILPVHHYIVP